MISTQLQLPIGIKRILTKVINIVLFFFEIPGNLLWLHMRITGKSMIFRDRFGCKFLLDMRDPIGLNVRRKAISDSTGVVKFVLKTVKRNQICVDVGAAYGAISVPMWYKVGRKGRVYSIEADPFKKQKIIDNLSVNHFPSRFVYDIALSDRKEKRPFRFYLDSPGWNTFGNPEFAQNYASELRDVDCIDLDSFMKNERIQKIHLVKIDTEGAELLVLSGMKSLLKDGRVKRVIFEVNPLMLPGMNCTPQKLLEFWNELPYDLYLLDEYGNTRPLKNGWSSQSVGDCLAVVRSS